MPTRYRQYPIKDFKDFIEVMLQNNATIQEIADKCHFSYHQTYKYLKQEGLIEKYQRRLRKRKPPMKMVKEVKHWPPQVRKLKYFPLRIPPTE
jgi:ribosomal protein L31